MLRRKPSKIEVNPEDKLELEEARKRPAAASSSSDRSSASLLRHFDLSSNDPSSKNQRIVEVKLRLLDSAAHQSVLSILSPYHLITHCQHNTFFDGAAAELSSGRAILRLRFYGDDSKCVASLKAKAVISNGVSRVEEDEEEIDPLIGRECVRNPNRILEIDSRIMKRVRDEFGVVDGGFVCLGGFRNVRGVHEWNGLKLEVDETVYDFGTCYEIECESIEPEKAKALIEEFLKENGIAYSYSTTSKFAIFRSGKLPESPVE